MILGTVITLGGLAYTVVYSVYNYSGITEIAGFKFYLLALAAYNACAIAALATAHPCYQFLDVGLSAFLVNLLFVFYANPGVNEPKDTDGKPVDPKKSKKQRSDYEQVLRATLFLGFLALFSNIANCADDCCKS